MPLVLHGREHGLRLRRRGRQSKAEDRAQRRGGKRGKTEASVVGVPIVEGDDDEDQSELVLMYNTVWGYVSAVNELWAY